MERYQPDQYGRMMPDAHGQWVSLREAEITALDAAQKSSADAQATVEALQAQYSELLEALDCVLTERPLPSGEYVHRVSCNGDRRKPAGTVGISCSCRVGQQQVEALQRERNEAIERAEQCRKDRAMVLTVKTTDGLTASEWVMRTAVAESEVVRLRDERDRLKEALECARYALTHRESYQTFALCAIDAALTPAGGGNK